MDFGMNLMNPRNSSLLSRSKKWNEMACPLPLRKRVLKLGHSFKIRQEQSDCNCNWDCNGHLGCDCGAWNPVELIVQSVVYQSPAELVEHGRWRTSVCSCSVGLDNHLCKTVIIAFFHSSSVEAFGEQSMLSASLIKSLISGQESLLVSRTALVCLTLSSC